MSTAVLSREEIMLFHLKKRYVCMSPITFIDRSTGAHITETPPGEGFLRFLYHNPFGKLALEALVKRKFLSSWYGRRMSAEKSARSISSFVETHGIDMSEAVHPIDSFASFNDFFYRKLKPEARPIGDGFVSPADGKLIAFQQINDLTDFYVKGEPFTVESFLRNASLAKQYEGGSMIIVRLAPNDYHRYHFPASGVAAKSVLINGDYLSVSPYAVRGNFARVFCQNKREYTVLETASYGPVVISPVGATMVGSIHRSYEAGSSISKGDEMGYFSFGGSSLLLLIPEGKLTIDQDLIEHTRQGKETFVKMGETIGQPIVSL